jgi:ribosomal protein S18 acetylase RimI-like enzyme
MIVYLDNPEAISPAQLAGGFWVGWPNPPSPIDHHRILLGSYAVWLALGDDTNQVVGFINAVSDGSSRHAQRAPGTRLRAGYAAYIPLLEVLPEYQGRGIGSELTRRMLATLRHCYQVDLICEPDVQPFYEKLGMRRAVGMIVRNYDRQSASE